MITWVPLAGVVLLLIGVTRQAAQPLRDPDMWWHLLLGVDFRQGRPLNDPGPFGAFSTEAWVPTQWLPEVVVSWFVDLVGSGALSWLFGVTLVALAVLIYAGSRTEGSALAAAVATGAMIAGGGSSLSPRPHMLTYVFLAITVIAWLRTSRDLKPRWWLIPWTWVWACSHGMWFVGPVTGIVVTSGLWLDRPDDRRAVERLLLIPLAGVAVAALTPVGPALLTAPFQVGGIAAFVTEWQPANFREFRPALTATMLATVAIVWIRAPHISWSRVGLLLLASGWTLLSVRTVTLGAITIAPLFAAALQSVLPNRPPGVSRQAEIATVLTAAFACLGVLALTVPAETSHAYAPRGLNTSLESLPPGTVIVNRDTLGGWLMWSHLDVTPVVDGLFESYSPDYLQSYVDAIRAVPGWQEFIQDSGASAALLGAQDPLAGTLHDQLGWEVLGTDSGYVLLVEPGTL